MADVASEILAPRKVFWREGRNGRYLWKIQNDLYLLELHNADLLVLEFLGILTEEQIGLGR